MEETKRSADDAQEMAIRCYFCDDISIADIAGQLQIEDPEMGYPHSTLISLVRCRRCRDIMLFQQENLFDRCDEFQWNSPQRLWPWEEGWLNEAIPERLRREHQHARNCFKVKAYTATVVMVRRTLEGVCVDHEVQEKPLAKALEVMHEQRLLDGNLIEWARELRLLGNIGAHFTEEEITSRDAEDALHLAEALLDYVYVFSRRFRQFRERRSGDGHGHSK